MKRWLVFLLLMLPARLFAQVPSCTTSPVDLSSVTATAAAVTTALATAPDNYVLCLKSTLGNAPVGNAPAGYADWTGQVDATVGGTIAGEIRGFGGFNSTCLQADDSTPAASLTGGCGSAQQTKIYMEAGTGSAFAMQASLSTHNPTISNIYFYSDQNSGNPLGQVGIGFVSAPYILHHNDFVTRGACNGFLIASYTNSGVIYRNRLINYGDGVTINCYGSQGVQHLSGGPGGEAVWASASTFGTADTGGTHNLYIEQNYIDNFAALSDLHDGGAREVWRFNEIHNAELQAHGYDSTGQGGGRGLEAYNNVFYCDEAIHAISTYVGSRTGTGFIVNNTFPPITASQCSQNNGVPPALLNQASITECNSGGSGWPGQSPAFDIVHNSYPHPHQIGWGWNSSSHLNPKIGVSPASGTALYQTNQPGTLSGWNDGGDGVEQSLEPWYAANNTNTGAVPVVAIRGNVPTNCRARATSWATNASQATTVLPSVTGAAYVNRPIPYANVGMQAVMVFADKIGGTAPTVTIDVHGTNSCGTITALNGGTIGGMRLSAWTCTVTIDGPQTITFTHDSSLAARAGAAIFMHGLTASPLDQQSTVATVSMSPYTATAPPTLSQQDEVIIGYFALPVPGTDNMQPGTSDNATISCGSQCQTGPGGQGFVGPYVGVNGTTSGSADVSVATTYRVVHQTSTTGLTPQEQDFDTTGATVLAGAVSFKVNGSTANFATVGTPLDNQDNEFINYNREVYDDYGPGSGTGTPFNGTLSPGGTGAGLASAIPNGAGGTCSNGVGYWATDVDNGNGSSINQLGALFQCGLNATSGHWPATLNAANAFYVPYPMPHPLNTIGGGPSQSFSSQPTNTVTGVAFSPSITVTVSPAAADSSTLSVTSGTCTFTGTATQTSDSMTGVATFSLTAGAVGTSCVLTAHNNTDGTLADVMSAAFNVTSSCVPDHLTFTGQPSNALVGGSLGTIHVAVKDSGGNTCTSDTSTVTLSAHAGSTAASLTSSSSLSKAAVAGVATWTDLSVTPTPGSISLDANDGMLTLGTSGSATISAAGSGGSSKERFHR